MSFRWAFKCSQWKPTKDQWLLASQCIQPEELERINKFVFQRDAKLSMIGRLLIRKAVADGLDLPWDAFTLSRSDKGKPVLLCQPASHFSFNVSHHGSFAVLAVEKNVEVGIDVMSIDRPTGVACLDEYFRLMRRQFTEREWSFIESSASEEQQLNAFYRLWCLKESFIKLDGKGLNMSLQSIDFHIHTPLLSPLKEVVTDTTVNYAECESGLFRFEEVMLDSRHHVATAMKKSHIGDPWPDSRPGFVQLTFNDLVEKARPLKDSVSRDLQWEVFFSKKLRQGDDCDI